MPYADDKGGASAQDKADNMVKHLASLSERRLVVSFAPYTPYYAVLKRIGEFFPGPSKVRPIPCSRSAA